ncbi:hypothetical protein Tco_0891773 [Tanacetum coccineum]|uniref:Uncharacterized protein n=1 Tax=Tanacetum coccineum TaxID=301880 RepID=A0ABQ5C487_9ASTR
MDNNNLNNKEWKESDYGNHLNTATDSFFKAHDEHDIEEGNEPRQMKHKEDNKNDEQPNKRVCKAEKFEAIKYSLGPNEEYIAIRRCEYNAWGRNKDSVHTAYSIDLAGNEIDNVGEVSIIWNPVVGSIEPLENPLDTRKLESSSYHALGACLSPYNSFLRR